MASKLTYGLIAIIFTSLIGTVFFYPYYVGNDVCTKNNVRGQWINLTEIHKFNSTYPAISRYYCSLETQLTPKQCLSLDRKLNVNGCKWGGKLSKSKLTLRVLIDPDPLLKSSYLKMIENYDGFVDPYTIYEVCNPTIQAYNISSKSKFNVYFMDTLKQVDIDYKILIGINNNIQIPHYIIDKCQKEGASLANGTIPQEKCTYKIGSYNEIEKWEYQEFNPIGFKFMPGKCYRIKVQGKREPILGKREPIDNIISYAGMNFTEYAWWRTECSEKRNYAIEPYVTDSNQQIYINYGTNKFWNNATVILNETNTSINWINLSDSSVWINLSVTKNTPLGIEIYSDCNSEQANYTIENVFLIARGYNSQASVDDYDVGTAGIVTDATYKMELNASMKMAGADMSLKYNLGNKNAGSNVTIIAYNYLDTAVIPNSRAKAYSVNSGSAFGSPLLGNIAYDEPGAGCQTTADKWCIGVNASYVLDYLPLTTTWNRHKFTINSTGTTLWNNDTFRYHSERVAWENFSISNGGHSGGTAMWTDLFYIYRDYGNLNPNITEISGLNINLSYPVNNANPNNISLNFNWTVVSNYNSTNMSCDHYLNGIINRSILCGNGTQCISSITGLSLNTHTWQVYCKDVENTRYSSIYTFINNKTFINISLSSNISKIIFYPNMSLYNVTTRRLTQYNISVLNQTDNNSALRIHNNGTWEYSVYIALNDTTPNNYTFKCGLSPFSTYLLNTSRQLLNQTKLGVNHIWDVWCYIDMIGANKTEVRTINITKVD